MSESLVVIPAYNEESTISNVIKQCAKFCDVLVVDDGSIDDTRSTSLNAGAIVLSNECNKGYEHSLNVGYAYASAKNYKVMVSMDGDGQLPPDRLPEFLIAIEKGASLVVGRREQKPRLCEKLLALSAARLSDLKDPYCGMKAYDLRALKRPSFSVYDSIGTSLALDYLEMGLKCENIDIEISEREGISKFGGKLKSELKLSRSTITAVYRLLRNAMLKPGTNNND